MRQTWRLRYSDVSDANRDPDVSSFCAQDLAASLFSFSIIPYAGFLYHLTRSKKASSSEVAPDVEVGGNGSGIMGVNVGDTAGASGAFGLWDNFVLYDDFSTVILNTAEVMFWSVGMGKT